LAASLYASGQMLPVSGTQTTWTTSTVCTTSTGVQGGGEGIAAHFTSNSSSPVRIDYVKALLYPGSGGTKDLQFNVGFSNTGGDDVYTINGCGSTLSSTILSGNGVVQRVDGQMRCLCAEGLSPLHPQQNSTEVDPGCWSGYSYRVTGSGNVTANLALSWYRGSQFEDGGTVNITVTLDIQ